jgi:hypothetical protein
VSNAGRDVTCRSPEPGFGSLADNLHRVGDVLGVGRAS